MARQLATRTIVAWFGNLSFDQQGDALSQLQKQHGVTRATKRVELETQLAALGYVIPKKRGRPRADASRNGGDVVVERRRRAKVKAKFRDPKTKETWSGRGRMARWLKAKQDAGDKIEKYLV